MKLGEVLEITLSDGRFAYGQYVYKDKKMGPIIQVFDSISYSPLSVSGLKGTKLLFPPIITGLSAALRQGLWRVVGHIAVENFSYPKFVSTLYDEKTGTAGEWFLWDGEKSIPLGHRLSTEYKKYEYLMVWSPYDVIHRIETREYPFPYQDLIHKNQFIPRPD